jgi:hypothetical protein
MSFDFNSVFKFAFLDWLKQKGIWKYFIFIFVFYTLINFAGIYSVYAAFSPIEGGETITLIEAINIMLFFSIYYIVVIFVSLIVSSILSYFLITKALFSSKKDFVEFNAKRWLEFIFLGIAEFFVALLSIFNIKFLLVPVSAIVLTILSILLFVFSYTGNYLLALLGILFIFLALLLFFVYIFIWFYNSIRLTVSAVIFVEKKKGIMESLKASWDLTKGNVVNIFIVFLVIGIAVGVLSWIVTLPLVFYQAGTNIAIQQNSLESFKQLLDPFVLLLIIPSVIIQSIFIIVQTFGLVAIYNELTKKEKFVKVVVKKKLTKTKRK